MRCASVRREVTPSQSSIRSWRARKVASGRPPKRQGRLGRTAQFIAGTTYGSHADAIALIERVRRIHEYVRGSAPNGQPYAADDPVLLTWVHVAEVSSFLAGYLRYVGRFPSPIVDIAQS